MNTHTKTNRRIIYRATLLFALMSLLTFASTRLQADTGNCGGVNITLPFTDVPSSNIFFCSIASAYFSGLTVGTSATTYSPGDFVTREQMAAFITRTMDQSLQRGSRRAALQQWWTLPSEAALDTHAHWPGTSAGVISDGQDIWAAITDSSGQGFVERMRANDLTRQQVWMEADGATGIIAVPGFIFITAALGQATPGKVYRAINSIGSLSPDVSVFADSIGINPVDITFDGTYLWTADVGALGADGSISRIRLSDAQDSTFTAGFDQPSDILWDGANLWVADMGDNRLKRVSTSNGVVLQSIAVGDARSLMFDGTNIWVSDFGGDSIKVVRAVGNLRGTVLATLTGNGMDGPTSLAFDGERVLVCNSQNNRLSLFKATDFTPLGNLLLTNYNPIRACSDGQTFFISSQQPDGTGILLRF